MIYADINGFKSSRIILGRDCTSKALDKSVFLRGMDVYADFGGNHFDTAHLYCGGESERLVGEWIKGKNYPPMN
jgi:aryl-alcohol dehydrogenase-like predicted oxidoreductase